MNLKLKSNPYSPPNEYNWYNPLCEVYQEGWDAASKHAAEEIVEFIACVWSAGCGVADILTALRRELKSQGLLDAELSANDDNKTTKGE